MVLAGLSDRADSFVQLLTVFLMFFAVLALTYFTTRFVGGYAKTKSLGRNFEVIESMKITNGKYLQIVRVGEKYICIGIGKDNVSFVCELSSDELVINNKSQDNIASSFKDLMDKARERISKGSSQNEK